MAGTFATTHGVSTSTSQGTLQTTAAKEIDPWDGSTLTWIEIVASTSSDWSGMIVNSGMLDSDTVFTFVGVGAAGSEVVIGMTRSYRNEEADYIMVPVPSGSRVAVANVCLTGRSTRPAITGILATTDSESAATIQEVGPIDFDEAVTNYITPATLTAATADNTKSAWTEISFTGGTYNGANNALNGDSLDQRYDYLGFWIDQITTGGADTRYAIDLGVGSAGNEIVIAENLPMYIKSSSALSKFHKGWFWLPWGRPAGERIAMRYQCNDVTYDNGLRIRLAGLR